MEYIYFMVVFLIITSVLLVATLIYTISREEKYQAALHAVIRGVEGGNVRINRAAKKRIKAEAERAGIEEFLNKEVTQVTQPTTPEER